MLQQKLDSVSIWSLIAILLYPFVFKVFQGLDMTDMGYYLAHYQLIFEAPESIPYAQGIWLSNVFGGVWYLIFGAWGLIGMQLSGVFVVFSTMLVCFWALRPYIPLNKLLLGLLLAEVFIYQANLPMNYNNLSALFFVLSAALLIQGLKQNSSLFFILSGFCMASNFFIRLPSVSVIVLSLLCFLPLNKGLLAFKQLAYLVSGFILGLVFFFSLMLGLGHLDYYLASVSLLFQKSQSNQSSHQLSRLIYKMLRQYTRLLPGLALSLGLGSVFCVWHRVSRKWIHLKLNLLLWLSLLMLVAAQHPYSYTRWFYFLLYCVLGSVYSLLVWRIWKLPETRYISLAALGTLVLVPLGSNNGLFNSIFGLWLAIPLALDALYCLDFDFIYLGISHRLRRFEFKISADFMQAFRPALTLALGGVSIVYAYFYTYRDTHERFRMHHSIAHPQLRFVYTTEKRAKTVQELLVSLAPYVKAQEELFAFGNLPLLHYLTHTRPFLRNPWPNLLDEERFQKELDMAIENKKLPVYVQHRKEVRNFTWPEFTTEFKDKQTIIQGFLAKNQYKKVWENQIFEIWLPPKRLP